jgi:glycosyltransferase involved in cell wall biosynthesis
MIPFSRGGKGGEAVRQNSLPERFILYAAAFPHKNHARLLEALRMLKEKGDGIKLVLTGAKVTGDDVITEMIKKMGLQSDTVVTGWLPFEDIPIYCAKMHLFSLLNEGLAFRHRGDGVVPVVCSQHRASS